jgi:gliding motility-associated-like protein
VLTFVNPPDYETPADGNGDNNYIVNVVATDNGTPAASTTQVLTISVQDLNEAPVFSSANTANPNENQINVLTVIAQDPENTAINYSLPATGDNDNFQINETTGVLTFINSPDFENPTDNDLNGIYIVTVVATDSHSPSLSTFQIITVTLVDLNESPVSSPDSYQTNEDTPLQINAPGILSNDEDPESGALTCILQTNVSSGTLALNDDGSFSYDPDPDFNGTDSFSYVANDGELSGEPSIVTINVISINDNPVATDDTGTLNEGGSITINIVENDSDVDGSLDLNTVFIGNVRNGTFVDNRDGTITFTHDGSETITAGFSYTINDDLGATSNQASVSLTVIPQNDAPVITSPPSAAINENALVVLTVISSDPEDNTVTYSLSSNGDSHLFSIQPTSGVLSFIAAPNYEAPLDADANNDYQVTIIATDDGTPALQSSQELTIRVNNVNEVPLSVDDAYTANEDNPLTISAPGVLENDSDEENDPLTVHLQNNVTHGNLTLNSDGSFTYSAELNYNGPDGFSYYISDGVNNSTVAQVAINVLPQNDAPVASNDTYNTLEDELLIVNSPGVLTNDFDIDGHALTATLVQTTVHGTLTLNTNGSFTYQPNLNFAGSDSFTYAANDGNIVSNTATVTINVGASNDAPVSQNDTYQTNEDTKLVIPFPGILGNDTDADNNTLSAQLVSSPSNGTLTLNPNGSFTYQPNADFYGNDSFSYQASDGVLEGNTATVSISVRAVNDSPVAADDYLYTAENTPWNLNVLANDADPHDSQNGGINSTSLKIIKHPKNGSALIIGGQLLNYTPYPGFYGKDTLSYVVFDIGYPLPARSDTAQVFIQVARVSPLAVNDNVTTDEDVPVTINVIMNDLDTDIDASTVKVGTPPSHGNYTILPDGSIQYQPHLNYNGSDIFTYTVKDRTQLESKVANVYITINAVPDAPRTINRNFSTREDVTISIDLYEITSDPEGNIDPTSVQFNSLPSNGNVINNPDDRIISYIPASGFSGDDSFSFNVTDSTSLVSNISTILISVSNQAPNAVNDEYTIYEDQQTNFSVFLNDLDEQNNILTSSVDTISGPINGTIAIDRSTGVITYIPDKNYFGPDNFIYEIFDTDGYSDEATVSITIAPVNDAPDVNDDEFASQEDQVVTMDVLNNDFDIDNQLDSASLVIFQPPLHGQVSFNSTNFLITYTPDLNYNGADTFIYEVADEAGARAQASVNIMLSAVNDAPEPQWDIVTTDEETPIQIDVLENDIDVEDNIVIGSVTVTTEPLHGLTSVDPGTGQITYTPELDYFGEDQFIYQVSDDEDRIGQATVLITVNNVADAPIPANDSYTLSEDTRLVMNVLLNDYDCEANIDSSRLSIQELPTNGSVEILNKRIIYVPNANFYGEDQFRYQVCDSTSLCGNALVEISVTPVNDAPVATNDYDKTVGQPSITTNVAGNDTDIDDNLDLNSIIVVKSPQFGEVQILTGTGNILYTPQVNYYGPDRYDYRICDTHGACDTATVFLEITTGNVPPEPQPDHFTTNEDTPVIILPLDNDTDPNDNIDPASLSILKQAGSGQTALDASIGQITYTPDFNFNGRDTIIYELCDLGDPALCSSDTVFITVLPINDDPIAQKGDVDTFDNTTSTINILDFCTDPDGDHLQITLHPESPDISGLLTNNNDGTFTYESIPGLYCTSERFVYQVCDPSGLCDTASVLIYLAPLDSDGDNIPDAVETESDKDGDGDPNYLDTDSDDDGISDLVEGGIANACEDELKDADEDSIPDYLDPDSDNDGVEDKDEGNDDCDNDGIPDYLDIEDDCVERLDVPDTFSPNGDGINDAFKIPGANDLNNDELYIYNRWGGLVYESKNYDNSWIGKSSKSFLGGEELPEGTYFFIYKPNDSSQVFKGTIYLKR